MKIKTDKDIQRSLAYYFVANNPVAFREFMVSRITGKPHRVKYSDRSALLDSKLNQDDVVQILRLYYEFELNSISPTDRVKRILSIKNGKSNATCKWFRDADFFYYLCLFYRKGDKELSGYLLKIFEASIKHQAKIYARVTDLRKDNRPFLKNDFINLGNETVLRGAMTFHPYLYETSSSEYLLNSIHYNIRKTYLDEMGYSDAKPGRRTIRFSELAKVDANGEEIPYEECICAESELSDLKTPPFIEEFIKKEQKREIMALAKGTLKDKPYQCIRKLLGGAEVQDIAREEGLTEANIRQIKSRFIKSIKKKYRDIA